LIKKIISGGQTGADQGGLEAGDELGLETGGTAPPGYMTDVGTYLGLRKYGLVEGQADKKVYPKRTLANVTDSDGTVLFGMTNSPGTRLTIKYCTVLGRPYLINPSIIDFRLWIKEHNIVILNVAGNRESKNPGLQRKVKEFIINALLQSSQKDGGTK